MFRIFVIGLLLCPCFSYSDVAIDGPLTIERESGHGKSYTGAIVLTNEDKTDQQAVIYINDYLFYADGRVIYGEPGSAPRSNSSWIKIVPENPVIPAAGKIEVQYTVRIPDDPKLIGTYWCMIMVQGVDANLPAPPAEGKTGPSAIITQNIRYGIQMITQIGDTGSRMLKFLTTKLADDNDRKILRVEAENPGERMLAAFMFVELYDENGKLKAKYEGSGFRLYPGTSQLFRADLTEAPKNKYRAVVLLDCGKNYVFKTALDIDLR